VTSHPFELISRTSQLRCAYCHETDRGELEVCECGSTLHRECREALGRCTTLGCQVRRAPTREAFSWFGLLAGIVVPLVCLIFDPFFFKGGFGLQHGGLQHGGSGGFLGEYAVPAYAFMGVEMTALAIALGARPRSRALALLLWLGALYALVLGIVLVPLSIVGIAAAGLGLLGFAPFFTAVAFFRAGWACYRRTPSNPAPVHVNKAS
jgi:hypothetical protein